MTSGLFARLTLFFAGLIGTLGVSLSAMAAHGEDPRLLGAAATACLSQAPALLALYAGFDRIRTATTASLLMTTGCLLFAIDLLVRAETGAGLFAMSAPTGGTMMILGWIAAGFGAFFRPRG